MYTRVAWQIRCTYEHITTAVLAMRTTIIAVNTYINDKKQKKRTTCGFKKRNKSSKL